MQAGHPSTGRKAHFLSWTAVSAAALATVTWAAGSGGPALRVPKAPAPGTGPLAPAGPGPGGAVQLRGPWEKTYRLAAGETVELSVHLDRPSALPANGRVGVEWTLRKPDHPADVLPTPEKGAREVHALGIYTAPTANWHKVLHALDPDVYMLYRAPVAGTYALKLAPVAEEKAVGDSPRWREKGAAPELFPLPSRTPWPAGTAAPVSVAVNHIEAGTVEQVQKWGTMLEVEPNDTPEQAQPLALVPNDDVRTYEITGTADDVEYFDNGEVGRSGDDWYRVELKGGEKRLVTAQLSMPGQSVAARVRCYKLEDGASPTVPLGGLLPVTEFLGKANLEKPLYNEGKQVQVEEGRDPNERVHQQDEQHRTAISRLLEPGKSYYFRVEANAPGYQLQLRVLRPAPYTDPRMAVRQGMYNHIGQVDAWLTNRPRGASVERRIRDSGNLLGTQCMSCHTQSGVWGPAVPMANGYRLENVQNYWHLLNVMYECLRPTNELKDAAVNTSLAPLDLGDGPAGSRAAGYSVVNAERVVPPGRLHSMQQLRTGNYVLQTSDPSGINAAGPGSNVGQNIVWLFSGEILNASWKKTGDPKYFRALEERARKVAVLNPKYTDDLAVRMEFFGRVFPIKEYPAEAAKAAAAEKAAGTAKPAEGEKGAASVTPEQFAEQVRKQLAEDEARLRAIQKPDGAWGFNPGTTTDGGKTWRASDDASDPSPTGLAVTGLTALGYGKEDPTVAKGVQALLKTQEPTGRWNRAAITGFVTTAYALHAIARLYPVPPYVPRRAEFLPVPNESLLQTVKRVQALALTGKPEFADLMAAAARDTRFPVRYWGVIGLGGAHGEAGVPVLVAALRDRAKPVREAAVWALRQTLLDDRGWTAVLSAYDHGDDATRAGVMQALGMRADAVLPGSRVDWTRLTRTLDRAMNDDPHPAVRAWAAKAAWQWWIWNPPVREAVNRAWVRMMERAEPNALVENSNRYSSHALFIANGHKANGSTKHQYKELAGLFAALRKRLEEADAGTKSLMARRLVAVGATFYQTAGGDGGPGQMGYSTPGAGALFGQAVVVYMRETVPTNDRRAILAGLEGAANVPHGPLQEFLIDFTLKAPEELRQAAAAAVSDPRSAMLQASTELVEPLVAQVQRGAAEPSRRASLSDPVIKLFSSVNWVIPKDAEQQRHFLDLMVPKFERYYRPEEITATADAAKKAEMQREMDAAWYLADHLGEVMGSNPDLRLEMVFERYFPTHVRNPLEAHFWVRSVPWLLEHKRAMPEPGSAAQPGQPAPPDPGLVIKDRALQLYLDALKPGAPAETRAAAVRISNQTAVRKNPEVLLALSALLKTEKDEKLLKIASNVVKQGSERFVPDLVAALQAEKRPGKWLSASGQPEPAFLQDITYFRDYVMPELARVKRNDQASCLGCHGVPGRVPSFSLKAVDETGYLPAADLLFNYRELQARVNLQDLEHSKILRKPLNVQDGKEDGHQGGRRYLPQDDGYLVLKRWVENQPNLLETTMSAAKPALLQWENAGSFQRESAKGREKGNEFHRRDAEDAESMGVWEFGGMGETPRPLTPRPLTGPLGALGACPRAVRLGVLAVQNEIRENPSHPRHPRLKRLPFRAFASFRDFALKSLSGRSLPCVRLVLPDCLPFALAFPVQEP